LVPGLWLAAKRHQAEQASRTVTLLIDGLDLYTQADLLGLAAPELGQRYRALGLNGIALYEETLETLTHKGKVVMMPGSELRAQALARGEEPPQLEAQSLVVAELEPGALAGLLHKTAPAPERITLAGRPWWRFSGDVRERPAGPDKAAMRSWHEAGWDIAYRPVNHLSLTAVGEDFPEEASYLIHAATEVAGQPDLLDELVASSQRYLTGLIEATSQDGMNRIIGRVPANRVFSISQDWLDTLPPLEVADKYLLAASERGARLLYLRPYSTSKMGNPFKNTERMIGALTAGLRERGFTVGLVEPLNYRADPRLRALSAVGIVASLGLLALMYPGLWGAAMAFGLLGSSVMVAGPSFDALALIAALSFPVIGYGLLPQRLSSLGVATLISLAGAVLLAAVGTDRNAMLAAQPFVGVAATLVVPPLHFLLHYALRYGRPADLAATFWRRPLRIGDAAVVALALLALAVVFLRRGNFPVIGVSGAELALRDNLAGWFAIRPRFKELAGHPAAVLALLGKGLPDWLRGLLLTGGVVAQASILNSFSHYHSPLLVSLARTVIALALGLALGLALTPLLRWATQRTARRLSLAKPLKRA
jgi:hypothetical protein